MKKIEILEAVRGGAAIYVFLHHAALFPNKGLGALLYFGQEAVIVFFLLSGFVIHYSVSRGGRVGWRDYILARFVRIYPIFLISLLLAYVSKSIQLGALVAPDWSHLLGNLFMLQDVSFLKPGVWVDTYYGNSPLWSLSYEWWFYMLYAMLGIVLGWRGWLSPFLISLVGCVTYMAAPNQLSLYLSYFYMWWAGVGLAVEYSERGEISFGGQKIAILACALMSILWAVPVFDLIWRGAEVRLGYWPFLQFRHSVAALLLVILVIIWFEYGVKVPSWLTRSLGWFAPISYAIYVTHQPILSALSERALAIGRFGVVISSFIIVLALSWILELKFQPIVRKFIRN